MIRRHPARHARPQLAIALGVALGIPCATASHALAQQGPTDSNTAQGAQGAQGAPGAGSTSTQQSQQIVYPYGFAPPAPGQPVGGGNATESSARPVTGDSEDSFDLGPKAGGGGTAFGSSNGPVFFQDGSRQEPMGPVGPAPQVHVVRKGDTLWHICDGYFHNPYQWPRIWSYNPQIQNPHWIYPNEQVRLKPPGAAVAQAQALPQERTGTGGGLVDRRRTVAPDTIFLRDEGFIDDESNLNWGSITGAPEDKMFLTDFDEAYLRIGPDHDVKLGQELTIFRPVRTVSNGTVISIGGTARVDQWNPQTRIARAQIVETLDTIERGARVGPVSRRFEVVAPVRNGADITAHVLIAVRPHVFYGQDQIVFIDKGADDGLRPGNRLFVVRRGDAWRGTMGTDRTADRVPLEKDTIGEVEPTPHLRDEKQYPEEIIGELRVLNTQKKSATCYVTRARAEIEINDDVVGRKGY